MKVKILAALKTKFVGVDEAILTRIAEKKATGVTDESQIPAIVEGVSFQDVLSSYGDFRAGDATQSAVKNYEKKHNLKDGKVIETKQEEKKEEKTDEVPAWAQALIDSNKTLSEKLEGYEQQSAAEKRNADILAKAKEYGIPENFISRFNIAEDADLDAYMKEAKQDFANIGFEGVVSPEGGNGVKDESSTIAELINKGTNEIVESKK